MLEKLCDQTIQRALGEGFVSRHVSADGTLVRANASFKSLVPIELATDAEEYKKRLRDDDEKSPEGPQDPGNRSVDFRAENPSNATHRSRTDPDCRFVSKGRFGTKAHPGYTVNALMENRHRFLLGPGVEVFLSSASETEGGVHLPDRAAVDSTTNPPPAAPTRASSTPT